MSDRPDLDHRFIGSTPLFSGLAEAETRRLVELGSLRSFAAGEIIFEEGSMGDSLFLLYTGEIEVITRDPSGKEAPLATLTEFGAFLGEMSLVDPCPRSATVRSRTQATLLELSVAQLEVFFTSFAETRVVFLRNIARTLAHRLRQANVRVAAGQAG